MLMLHSSVPYHVITLSEWEGVDEAPRPTFCGAACRAVKVLSSTLLITLAIPAKKSIFVLVIISEIITSVYMSSNRTQSSSPIPLHTLQRPSSPDNCYSLIIYSLSSIIKSATAVHPTSWRRLNDQSGHTRRGIIVNYSSTTRLLRPSFQFNHSQAHKTGFGISQVIQSDSSTCSASYGCARYCPSLEILHT